MRRLLFSLVSIAGVTSCSGEKKGTPPPEPEVVQPTFKTERIECFVAAGEMGPGGRMDAGRRGPDLCKHILTTFLADNASRHVVAIVPIEFPLEPTDAREVRKQGTQELLVTTADRGNWPTGGELEAHTFPCEEPQEGKPPKFEPQACIKAMTKFMTEKTAFWVSLSGPAMDLDPTKEDVRPRTMQLLSVSRRAR